jgi:hypothetical protein
MSNRLPELDIDELLDALKARFTAKFPALQTVDDYFRLQDAVAVPAVAFDIVGIAPDGNGDAGTGQFAAEITLAAYCIVSYKAQDGVKAKRCAASLAASVAAFVFDNRWGCPVQIPTGLECVPDVFPAKSAQYECWRVEWKHGCFLGCNIWAEKSAFLTSDGARLVTDSGLVLCGGAPVMKSATVEGGPV